MTKMMDEAAMMLKVICKRYKANALIDASNTDYEARLDIRTQKKNSSGVTFQRNNFDVKDFNPQAMSFPKTIRSIPWSNQENMYEQRFLKVVKNTFNPLVFFYKRASWSATKVFKILTDIMREKAAG